MKKIIWIIIAIIIIAVIVGLIRSNKVEDVSVKKTIKIGVILPLTGDLAFLGEPAKKGAEMALENFKDTKNKYELIFEDDQFNAPKAATAANKLISVDKVDVIVTFGSSGGNVVKPLADKNKIVHFTVASDSSIPDGAYTFVHWTPPQEEVRVMVSEFKERGITKIGIIAANQAGMQSIVKELRKQLEGTGITITSDEMHNVGETDFRTIITKVKQNLPQIFLLINFSPEIEILAKQMKEAGIKTPMTSIESFDQTTQPELFKGYWYVSASDPNDDFSSAFKTKYGSDLGFGTGNVYDIISLIVTAMEKTSSTDVVVKLKEIKDFKGAMGNLSVQDNGIVFSTATVKVVK